MDTITSLQFENIIIVHSTQSDKSSLISEITEK